MMAELRRLWWLLDAHDIHLAPIWIATAQNRLADAASRLAFPRDYTVHPSAWAATCQRWGAHTVDAFASPATTLLPHFWAPRRCDASSGVDAFAQRWEGEVAWAHPPPGLLPRLAHFLREVPHGPVTVCAPC
jgi:hypothetical protein